MLDNGKVCAKESAGQWISALHRQFNSYMSEKIKDYDINTSEYVFIVNLDKSDSINQENLSAKLSISKSATTKAMKRLEKLGYVMRVIDKNDRRAYKVTLTKTGVELKDELMDFLSDWLEIITMDITDEENKLVIDILKKMSKGVNKMIE